MCRCRKKLQQPQIDKKYILCKGCKVSMEKGIMPRAVLPILKVKGVPRKAIPIWCPAAQVKVLQTVEDFENWVQLVMQAGSSTISWEFMWFWEVSLDVSAISLAGTTPNKELSTTIPFKEGQGSSDVFIRQAYRIKREVRQYSLAPWCNKASLRQTN